MPYLSITDGRIARYDSSLSPKIIEGFYTDNFSSCNIVILYQRQEDNIRISMIHADISIIQSDIENEINWVGMECKRIVVRREYDPHSQTTKERVLGSLANNFEEKFCPENNHGISININGEIKFYSYIELPELITHLEEWSLNSFYKLNLQFNKCYTPEISLKNTKLLFNCNNWQDLSEHDVSLLPLAKDFIETLKKNNYKKIDTELVRYYIKDNYALRNLSYKPHGNDYIIAIYALQLMTNNDHMLLFKQQLNLALKNNGFSKSDKEFIKKFLITSNDYKSAKELIFETQPATLKDKIVNFLADIYTICHHANAQKISSFQEKIVSHTAPFNIASSMASHLTITKPTLKIMEENQDAVAKETGFSSSTTGISEHRSRIQQLLKQGYILPQPHPSLIKIAFNDLQAAKDFAAELLKSGFGNRNMPSKPKKIEPILADSNSNNNNKAQDCYAIQVPKVEWDALRQNEQLSLKEENLTALESLGSYQECVPNLIAVTTHTLSPTQGGNMLISIIGEKHTNTTDKAFLRTLTKKAEKGEIILIMEGLCFGGKLDENIIGVEDQFFHMFSLFIMAYCKGLVFTMELEKFLEAMDRQKNESNAELILGKKQEIKQFKEKQYVNWYVKALLSFFQKILKEEQEEQEEQIFYSILLTVSEQLKQANNNIHQILHNFTNQNNISALLKNIQHQKLEIWDDSQSFPEEHINNFLEHKLIWNVIFKIIILTFAEHIADNDLKNIVSQQLNLILKDNPTHQEIIEIGNEISEVITIDIRNKFIASNLELIAQKYKDKPIYFIVGDKHIDGLKAILDAQLISLDIRYYKRPEKPPEFESDDLLMSINRKKRVIHKFNPQFWNTHEEEKLLWVPDPLRSCLYTVLDLFTHELVKEGINIAQPVNKSAKDEISHTGWRLYSKQGENNNYYAILNLEQENDIKKIHAAIIESKAELSTKKENNYLWLEFTAEIYLSLELDKVKSQLQNGSRAGSKTRFASI